jgi:hypothetical protein
LGRKLREEEPPPTGEGPSMLLLLSVIEQAERLRADDKAALKRSDGDADSR